MEGRSTRLASPKRCVRTRDGGQWGVDELNAYDLAMYPGPKSDYYNSTTYGTPEAHCDLLFAGAPSIIPRVHSQTTLASWCTLFVGDVPVAGHMLDPTAWLRWKACVAGSFDWAAVMAWIALVEPYDERRRRWCPQLLDIPFLDETQRRESFDLCNIVTFPPTGQWRTWGDGTPEGA